MLQLHFLHLYKSLITHMLDFMSCLASDIHHLAERRPTKLFHSRIFSEAPHFPCKDKTGPIGRIKDAQHYTLELQAEDRDSEGALCHMGGGLPSAIGEGSFIIPNP